MNTIRSSKSRPQVPAKKKEVAVDKRRPGPMRRPAVFVYLLLYSAALYFGFYSLLGASPGRNVVGLEIHADTARDVAENLRTPRNLSPSPSSQPRRLEIAVAVIVPWEIVELGRPYIDGAAVLQHSIRMTNSVHNITMVAIVHSGIVTSRPVLARLGFEIIEFPLPITSAEIKGEHLRDTIDKSGCCGALELLKLCAWKMVQFDRVLVMDMDTIWMQNLDSLFERNLRPGGVMFTYSHALDSPGSRAPPVEGGFLLVSPFESTYEQLVGIVRIGDFRPVTGWAGSKIGWCWGGQTIQGLISYFVKLVEPGLGVALDPCEYNSMGATMDCKRSPKSKMDTVKSIHYNVCQKPWECTRGANSICAAFLHAWWMVR